MKKLPSLPAGLVARWARQYDVQPTEGMSWPRIRSQHSLSALFSSQPASTHSHGSPQGSQVCGGQRQAAGRQGQARSWSDQGHHRRWSQRRQGPGRQAAQAAALQQVSASTKLAGVCTALDACLTAACSSSSLLPVPSGSIIFSAVWMSFNAAPKPDLSGPRRRRLSTPCPRPSRWTARRTSRQSSPQAGRAPRARSPTCPCGHPQRRRTRSRGASPPRRRRAGRASPPSRPPAQPGALKPTPSSGLRHPPAASSRRPCAASPRVSSKLTERCSHRLQMRSAARLPLTGACARRKTPHQAGCLLTTRRAASQAGAAAGSFRRAAFHTPRSSATYCLRTCCTPNRCFSTPPHLLAGLLCLPCLQVCCQLMLAQSRSPAVHCALCTAHSSTACNSRDMRPHCGMVCG